MEKKVEKNEVNPESRVPHIIDMHLDALYIEKADKMAVDLQLMLCQINDVQKAASDGVTKLDSFERSLVFASLSQLRAGANSILNAINEMSTKTMVWGEKRCVQKSQPAKPRTK